MVVVNLTYNFVSYLKSVEKVPKEEEEVVDD
jgi:hypothetical protein